MALKSTPGAAGVDEAGRGPLAGPVVAAAVIFPRRCRIIGLNDSKKLTALQREELAVEIKAKGIWAVASASREEIDRLNILWASMEAMRRALELLSHAPIKVYVDGNRCPPGLTLDAEAVIKGDGKIACIAAASILAKTARDAMLCDLATHYPQYGFERHFGYSTPEHLRALAEHGPCPEHRRSFQPVRALDPDEEQQLCLTFAE